MNLKGQLIMAKEVPKILFYLLFLVVVAFILIFNVGIFSSTEIIDDVLKERLPILMLWTSSDCLAYSGEKVGFPAAIDLNKFTQERLEKCFDSSTQGITLNFTSFDEDLNIEIEVNKEYTSKGVLCGMKTSGLNCFQTRKYVLYIDGEDTKKGMIDFKVVTLDG